MLLEQVLPEGTDRPLPAFKADLSIDRRIGLLEQIHVRRRRELEVLERLTALCIEIDARFRGQPVRKIVCVLRTQVQRIFRSVRKLLPDIGIRRAVEIPDLGIDVAKRGVEIDALRRTRGKLELEALNRRLARIERALREGDGVELEDLRVEMLGIEGRDVEDHASVEPRGFRSHLVIARGLLADYAREG
jgi:hypothetical protein